MITCRGVKDVGGDRCLFSSVAEHSLRKRRVGSSILPSGFFYKIFKLFEVKLSVYNLHGSFGVYHVGVEVAGLEWSFGAIDDGTGVFFVMPRTSTIGKFKESIVIGKTDKTVEEIVTWLKESSLTWRGSQYHILTKNCLWFSQSFLSFLLPGETLPSYTTSTAESLKPFASIVATNQPVGIQTFVTSVATERMWREARTRMGEFEKTTHQTKGTSRFHPLPLVLHSIESNPPADHNIRETIDYVKSKRDIVTHHYSNYAKSFLR